MAQVREEMRTHAHLTPEQHAIAVRWAAGAGTPLPPGLWNEIALREVRTQFLSTPRVARVFAMLNMAEADAGVSAWDCKYAYWSPRPVNAIRDLGLDATWTPVLPTPPFPSYVSAHATFSGAAAEVLSYLFPSDAATLRADARQAAVSRLYGGIHWPIDNSTGLRMGQEIGRTVVAAARRDGADPAPTG
jgi:membrane-associated phospholipid phosphatase